MKRRFYIALAIGGFVAGLAAPAIAHRPAFALFEQLEKGLWELRVREVGAPVERICVRDPDQLIQLRHPVIRCDQHVLSNQPGDLTIHYSCQRRGSGRTHIRRESARLLQIDSQGIADGLPFAFEAEARRVGDCGS